MPIQAGPRQTVARVNHPTHGPGIAVYRNGPSFFQPDGGEPMLAHVTEGGYRQGLGSFLRIDGVDVAQSDSGLHHCRRWSPMLGDVWLVWGGHKQGAGFGLRIEPDAGRAFDVSIAKMWAGDPALARAIEKNLKSAMKPTPEQQMWCTYETSAGEILSFRKGPPETAPAVDYLARDRQRAPVQQELFAYPRAHRSRHPPGRNEGTAAPARSEARTPTLHLCVGSVGTEGEVR